MKLADHRFVTRDPAPLLATGCPRCGEPWGWCVCSDDDEPEYAGAFEARTRETEQ